MRIVQELDIIEVSTAVHSTRRIIIAQREDGFYTYAEQYHYLSQSDGEIIAEGLAHAPRRGHLRRLTRCRD